MAKKKKNDPEISLSFEEALGKLEAIVQSLEEGKVGLEESLSLYEQGATLLKQGHQLLAEAEHRIEPRKQSEQLGSPRRRRLVTCRPTSLSSYVVTGRHI